MLFQVDFISRAVFELTCPNSPYSSLLAINHDDQFLSLSNEDHYVLLLPDQKLNFFSKQKSSFIIYRIEKNCW